MAGGLQPLQLGRNPLHSSNFSDIAIGNSGNSDCSPDQFIHSGRNYTDPLNLNSFWEYPVCPLSVFSVAASDPYQCFLGRYKIVDHFEPGVVSGNKERSH